MSQLEHWKAVGKQVTTVESFIEWIGVEYGVIFTWDCAKPGTPLELRKLIDEFFEVDRPQLDKERRELIDSTRDPVECQSRRSQK